MTEGQARMILTYAKNNMNAKRVGKELYVSDGDVHYTFLRIKEETGLNPKEFYDLCRLVGIAVSVTGGRL